MLIKRMMRSKKISSQLVQTNVFVIAFCLLLVYLRVVIHTQSQLPVEELPVDRRLEAGCVRSGGTRQAAVDQKLGTEVVVDTTENGPSYASALSTLRCLATPNCFPSSTCRTGTPQKLKRWKKWEEHSFCVDDVANKKDPAVGCLVYSFGIHTSWELEAKIANLLHCEVHAFDPTMNHPTNLAPNVTFHKLGLQAEGTDMSETHAAEYDAIDPSLLLTLGQIMERLGHVGRKLDVLALDCEGCEWGALRQLACSGESTMVDQIFAELHFQRPLGLATPTDVVRAAEGINCLWHHRWHVVSIEHSGASAEDWDYTRGITEVIHDGAFLLYVSLQRIPDDQPRPADHLTRAVQLSKDSMSLRERYAKQYETDVIDQWPVEARDVFLAAKEKEGEAYALVNKVSRSATVVFDEHPLFLEG